MAREEVRLIKYFYDGNERIKIIKSDGVVLKSFIYDERRKNIKNFSKEKYASEESILNYFSKRHKKLTGEDYIPTSDENFEKQIIQVNERKKGSKYKSKERVFKKGSSIIFTNKKRLKNFDYTYVSVIVKVYFNGFYTETSGRSDYVTGRQIKDSEINELIQIAVRRAVAPFGSNVNFRVIDWNIAYYRDEFTNAELRGIERPISTIRK